MKRNSLAAKFTKGAFIGAWLVGVGLVNLGCDNEKSLHWDGYYKDGQGSTELGSEIPYETMREINEELNLEGKKYIFEYENGVCINEAEVKAANKAVWDESTDSMRAWTKREAGYIDDLFAKNSIININRKDYSADFDKPTVKDCADSAEYFNAAYNYVKTNKIYGPVKRKHPDICINVRAESNQVFGQMVKIPWEEAGNDAIWDVGGPYVWEDGCAPVGLPGGEGRVPKFEKCSDK